MCYEPLDDDKGRVVIYSLPSSVHEKTSSGVYLTIMRQVVRAGDDLWSTVFNTKSTTFQVGASRRPHYQQADESLKPENLRVGGQVLAGTAKQDPFPNVVIEVAYKNQTFDKLLEKLHNWIHPRYTSVQVGIGIHISPNSNRRRAILLVRGQPVQETVTEFGDNIAITPLTLEFPMACIFEGVVWPNALLGHENDMISIDLIALRQFIHNCIART
ncbi:hypothetical protein AC1031_014666 [Aphanomyces cochlioides]|nr:hypothetical protein AC1031_014666 [Aphanomyces cochlioides]